MRTSSTFLVVGLLTLSTVALVVQGEPSKFGECPKDFYCEQQASGQPFPPDAVTGHSVYARFMLEPTRRPDAPPPASASPLPPAPPLPGAEAPPSPSAATTSAWHLAQAECVSWFKGKNVDVRPDPDPNFYDAGGYANVYFSDEDQPVGDDISYQDYDPDRSVESCMPEFSDWWPHGRPTDFAVVAGFFGVRAPFWWNDTYAETANYAAVVEKGDCDPTEGVDFRYRGHLDFVDPNSIYHEVQEYDYVCGDALQGSGPGGNLVPGGPGAQAAADAAKDQFPWTRTAADQVDGCADYEDPRHNGSFDWGHKCNGSIQDLFTERLWITPVHDIIVDPSINAEYNFALALDTCSGVNDHESEFFGDLEPYDTNAIDYLLDGQSVGTPLAEVCHDGSSFSFDDTARGRVAHDGPPASPEDIMRGTSYDSDPNSTSFGMHRMNCRSNYLDWPYNDFPGVNRAPEGPAGIFDELDLARSWRYHIGDDCLPEDHKNAQIDIYTFDQDPTGGLFLIHSNGLTGANQYVESVPTDPNYLPPRQP